MSKFTKIKAKEKLAKIECTIKEAPDIKSCKGCGEYYKHCICAKIKEANEEIKNFKPWQKRNL